MPLPPGAKLGPYEVLSLLGAGGMGEVYRARDPRLNREVAIKVLPAEGGTPRQLTNDPGDQNVPLISRDGQWMYFSAGRSVGRDIWRMPAGWRPTTAYDHDRQRFRDARSAGRQRVMSIGRG